MIKQQLLKDITEQDSIPSDLYCSICCKYLTCLPILLRPNGESMCGRCTPPDKEKLVVVRNNAFEKLVSNMIFPCCFKDDGCDHKDAVINLQEHEMYCAYKTLACPFLPQGSCSWRGSQSSLLEHYQTKHPTYILTQHPCSVKPPTLAKSMENCLLVPLFNKLFLLQIRYNVSSAKYFYDVRLLDNPSETQYYEYKFEIIGHRKGNYINKCDVLEQELCQVTDNTENQIDMDHLLPFFGRFEHLTFLITIQERENVVKCFDCKKNMFFKNMKNTFCPSCSKIVNLDITPNKIYNVKCSKHNEGCSYFDKEINVKKHEIWFCEFAKNICSICDTQVTDLFNHYYNYHKDKVFTKTLKMDKLSLNCLYLAILIVEDAIFICIWNFTRSFLEIKVISNLPKSDNYKYDCILKLTNPETKFAKKYRLPLCSTNVAYDWLGIVRYDSDNLVVSTLQEDIECKDISSKNGCAHDANIKTRDINVYNKYNMQLMMLKKNGQ